MVEQNDSFLRDVNKPVAIEVLHICVRPVPCAALVFCESAAKIDVFRAGIKTCAEVYRGAVRLGLAQRHSVRTLYLYRLGKFYLSIV